MPAAEEAAAQNTKEDVSTKPGSSCRTTKEVYLYLIVFPCGGVGGKRWTDRDECRRRMRANGKGLGRQKPEDNRWILTDLAGNTTTNILLKRNLFFLSSERIIVLKVLSG